MCGTETCATGSWSNIRLVDQSSSSSVDASLDMGPLYRPDATSDAQATVSGHANSITVPVSIAFSVAGAVALAVLFALCRRRRRRRRRHQQSAPDPQHDGAPYHVLESPATTPPSSATSSNWPPVASSETSRRTASAYYHQASPHITPPPLVRRAASHRSPEMVQTQTYIADAPRNLPIASPLSPAASLPLLPPLPPPLPPRRRIRATTFSDVAHDDLPPYIDPIDEALASDSPLSPESGNAETQPNALSPPAYDDIATPGSVEMRP
ncbi:hypothetical protein LPJ61_001119 [Coemansia biformis]|uniref:Uncharacterized protein n=1 Tax=Coemansia biformis TaxID=1286918 RepID=A0A9W7YFG3_9FUNG|nr:hypothetical protein LPJ61_001119 [Coemansia biformis]